jgi:hypothetical protein
VSPARPLGAPIVEGPDAASTLLTSWGAIRVGYIFVYGDGRVIFSPHDAAFLPMGATRFSVAERHLSPRGLQLVRAGKLTAKRLLLDPIYVPVKDRKVQPHGRSELWVEPTARSFEPSKYAIGVGFGADHASALDTTRAIAQLPPPAQALLAGKQRTCNPHTGTGDWSGPSGPPTECFEITPAEHATFWQILDPNGELDRPTPSHPWYEPYWPIAVDGRVGFISADPIFPHGQPVRQLGG